MARILIVYSTVDGHTRAISERMRQSLESSGDTVTLASLSDAARPDVRLFERVVIGASIRYGKHRPEVFDFIDLNRESLKDRPSAFFSVNVVARKPGKDAPATNPYVKAFLKRTTWQPDLIGVFGGKIDYQKYGFLDRNMIRLIMWITHGPTDPAASVDFTNWDGVEAFARQIARLQVKPEGAKLSVSTDV
jgi:menaquinone-dependent protoporphyrinogen oxidase